MSDGGGARADDKMSERVKEEPAGEAEGALWAPLGALGLKREPGLPSDVINGDADFACPVTRDTRDLQSDTEALKIHRDLAAASFASSSHEEPNTGLIPFHNEDPNTIKPCQIKLQRIDHEKRYKCPICQKALLRKEGLRIHILTHTQNEINTIKIDKKVKKKGKFKCHICSQRLSRKEGLAKHLKIHAKDPFKEQIRKKTPKGKIIKQYYECDVCGRQTTRKESLARHLERHDTQEPVYCAICNEPFKTAWELLDHFKLHDEEEVKTEPLSEDLLQTGSTPECYSNETEHKTVKIEETIAASSENNTSEDELLDEEVALGTNEETYYCGICEEQYETSSLGEHQCKRPKKPFTCDICNRKFQHQCLLDTHFRLHTGEKPFSCKICKKRFRIKGELKNHEVIHTDQKPKCDICQKQFTCSRTLILHKLLHTGEEPKKPYSCKMCKKKYKSPGELETHIRIHAGERPFSCDICKKQFLRKNHLIVHFSTHREEKHSCSICKKQLRSSAGLQRHMKVHSGEKPYSCEVCKKQFRLSSTFKNHKRVHTGEKPFACEFCQKRFKQQAHLFTHRRTHTGEKPFSCTVCNKSFAERSKLKKHGSIHTGEKPYACDVCNKAFRDSSTLKLHKGLHTGEKPFACQVCNKAFLRKNHLKDHMRSHTKDWPFFCEVCEKRCLTICGCTGKCTQERHKFNKQNSRDLSVFAAVG